MESNDKTEVQIVSFKDIIFNYSKEKNISIRMSIKYFIGKIESSLYEKISEEGYDLDEVFRGDVSEW